MNRINNITVTLLSLSILSFSVSVAYAKGSGDMSRTDSLKYSLPGTMTTTDSAIDASAVSVLTGAEIVEPTPNIMNMLYGKIPGLYVMEGSGNEPGDDVPSFAIRGRGTYNNTSIPVFVDGFQTEMQYLRYMSPEEIESIKILKDAVSLAPFGMRGANGVIWVTTKRGVKSNSKIQVNMKGGVQQALAIQKPLGTRDYADLYNEAYSNDNGNIWQPFYSEEAIAGMPDVDWYDEVLKDVAPYSSADVSVRGGNDYAKYYVLFGYTNQQGLYDVANTDTTSNASLNLYNLRTNLDMNLFGFLEAKIDLGGRIEKRRSPNIGSGNLWNNMAKYPSSVYSVKNDDGTWTGTPIFNANPVASINALGLTATHDMTLQTNLQLKEKLDIIAPGLYLMQAISFSNFTRDGSSNTRQYSRWLDGVQQTTANDTPYSRGENKGTKQWLWSNYKVGAGYDGQFGGHALSASMAWLYNQYYTDVSANNLAEQHLYYKHMTVNGALNYSYERRYSVLFSFAADGSDNYKPGNRWGFYPALGFAWTASNEAFLSSSNAVSFLKLSLSAGKSGWDPFGEMRYLWEGYYTGSGGMNTGVGTPTWHGGQDLQYIPNPDIFAESCMKYNLGLNSVFFNKLYLDADLYLEKRSGIVSQNFMIPGASGVDNPMYENIGKVTNKGIDISLSWCDHIGEFSYSLTGIASMNDNIVDYKAEVVTVPAAAATGKRMGAILGYEAIGFYDWNDFDVNGDLKDDLPRPTFGKVQPGDIKYKNNNDDKVIDENDQIQIGSSGLPRLQYSMQLAVGFKGFDFHALLQGAAGKDVNLLNSNIQNVAFRDNGNVYSIAQGRWAYYPEQGIDTRSEATYPRLSLEANNNNYRNSTLWVRNTDFLKLRNVELGYSFKFNGNNASKMRVYLNGMNLLTFSKITSEFGADPEALTGHPAFKSYNLGLSVTF